MIETPESIAEEIRKKINFYNGDTLGGIYRIVPNHPRRPGNLKPHLGAISSAGLVAQLANPNRWNRQTAHRLLLERQDRAAVPELKKMASNAIPEARVHALWLLDALGCCCRKARNGRPCATSSKRFSAIFRPSQWGR